LGSRAKLPEKKENPFLNSCFWDFQWEYNFSNANQQFGIETGARGIKQRFLMPSPRMPKLSKEHRNSIFHPCLSSAAPVLAPSVASASSTSA
jgi:hypothetical protein